MITLKIKGPRGGRVFNQFSLGWVFLVPFLLGAVDYYVPSVEGERSDCSATDEIHIDPKYALRESLNQKSTGTCYAHTAYFLAQYLYEVDQKLHQKNENPERLSLVDFTGIGCGGKFMDEGYPYTVLHHLKNQSVHVNQDFSIEDAFHYSDWIHAQGVVNTADSCKKLKETFSLSQEDLVDDVENIVTQILAQDKKKAAHSILSAAVNRKHPKVTLPPYNIEIFESTDELRVQEQMRKLLKPNPANSVSYPVGLDFCPHERDDGNCDGYHLVVVTGARKLCCGEKKQDCFEEWNVRNSYGGEKDGWFQASELSRSSVKYKRELTTIRPCKNSSSDPSDPHACHPEILGQYPIHYLAKANDPKLIHQLFQSGKYRGEVNRANGKGWTPLHDAARMGHSDVIHELISAGANKNQVIPGEGEGALSLASSHGHLDVVNQLISLRADLNQLAANDWTPLHIAAANGHAEIVKALLLAKADKDRPNLQGWTPLHTAAMNGHLEVVRELLRAKMDINKSTHQGWTPLNYAANQGKLDVVKLLVESGANLEMANQGGYTPLAQATFQGKVDVVRYLIQKGANPEARGNDGRSIEDLASVSKDPNYQSEILGIIKAAILRRNKDQRFFFKPISGS